MAYGVRYRIEYNRTGQGGTRWTKIDIEERDYNGSITNLRAQGNPLEISWSGDIENIFQPIVPTGATIRVVTPPFQLINLFTDDPQKYRVKIYKWGIAGDKLFWQGFITANIYTEAYASLNSPITLQANDGLTILKDIPFKVSESVLYQDTSTFGNTLDNILAKLNIDLSRCIKSSNLVVYQPNLLSPFTSLKVINDNYVDESGEVMSCWDVLQAIVGGMGLTFKLKGDTMYFIDPISLRDSSNCRHYLIGSRVNPPILPKWKEYVHDPDGFTPDIGGTLDISLNQVKWKTTDINLDITPIANKLFIEYNPYNFTSINYDFDDKNNWSNAGTFVPYAGVDASYWVNTGVTFKGWDVSNGTPEGIKQSEYSSPTFYIKLKHNTNGSYSYQFPNSYLLSDASLNLNISFDAYVSTIGNYPYDGGTSYDIWYMDTSIAIQVGTKYYAGGVDDWGNPIIAYHWHDTETFRRLRIIDANQYRTYDSRINDVWTPVTLTIPLYDSASVLEGKISIKILDEWNRIFPAYNSSYVKNILIKNLKAEVVASNSLMPIQNNPIRMIAQKESTSIYAQGNTIGTKQGTGPYGCSKGSYLYSSSSDISTNDKNLPIKGFSYTGDSSIYDSNHLLLRNYISQYSSPRFKRTGLLDVTSKLFDTDLFQIKESNRMGNKSFYIISGTYVDRYRTMEVEMVECASTRDSIS